MTRGAGNGAGQAGLTLIEILLVLFIIGLGWFTLLPKLDLAGKPANVWGSYPELNEFMDGVRQAAEAACLYQEVSGQSGSDKIAWKDKDVRLPRTVNSVKVNGQDATGQRFVFRVYPDGHMDKVRFTIGADETVESNPLTCRFDAPSTTKSLGRFLGS